MPKTIYQAANSTKRRNRPKLPLTVK